MSSSSLLLRSLLVCGMFLVTTPQLSSAQDEKKKEKAAKPPEVVEITTKDKVILKCTWFAGTHEKETVPVIMLHDWGGSRNDLTELAEKMRQEYGFAIIVPDLRGHGESVNVEGSSTTLEPEKWKPAEIASMIADIEACKKFLIKKNNEGELNIDLLTLVAQGKLCIHTLQWSINDWQFEPLGGIKQGKDVKSLVLLAPEKSFRGLNLSKTVKHPLFTGFADRSLSMLVMGDADKSDKAIRESKQIYTQLDRMRKENSAGKNFLHYFAYRTKKQIKVVENNKVDVPLENVVGFFIANEAKRFATDFRWQDRKRD